MTKRLENSSHEEVHNVIWFLWVKNILSIWIHCQLITGLCWSNGRKWCKEFENGQITIMMIALVDPLINDACECSKSGRTDFGKLTCFNSRFFHLIVVVSQNCTQQCNVPVSTVTELLNSCHNGSDVLVYSGLCW
jgi:hypothetical protein